jgi:hypothetical protein
MTFLLHGALGFLDIFRWFRPVGHGLVLLGLGMGLFKFLW